MPDSGRDTPLHALHWRAGDLELDLGLHRVGRAGEPVELPGLTFDLLLALIHGAPNFVSNEELMTRVWKGVVVSPETVTQRVKLLRDALGDDPKHPR
jgi:DNA-binding winged helix-turn-helix (wHTH) protein